LYCLFLWRLGKSSCKKAKTCSWFVRFSSNLGVEQMSVSVVIWTYSIVCCLDMVLPRNTNNHGNIALLSISETGRRKSSGLLLCQMERLHNTIGLGREMFYSIVRDVLCVWMMLVTVIHTCSGIFVFFA
jgi:hypothetical protein